MSSTETVYLTGKAYWAKLIEPDAKYKNWTLDLYPDEESLELYKQTGMTQELRENDKGEIYIKFRRPTSRVIKEDLVKFDPPAVWLDKKPYTGLIGNESEVTIKVSYYDTFKGVGHRLDAVRINKLVEFDPDAPMKKEPELPF